MTSGSDSAPWRGPALSRWGHYGPIGLATSVAAIVALGLNPVPVGRTSALVAPLAILVFALLSWRAMRQHDRRLCEVCATSMPLNTAEVASRYSRRFAVVHVIAFKSIVIGYVAVLIGADVLLLPGPPVARIAWAAIQSTMVYLVLAYSSHRRFQPWCPQCHGGGGDRSDDRDPAPLGRHSG